MSDTLAVCCIPFVFAKPFDPIGESIAIGVDMFANMSLEAASQVKR